MVALGGKDIMLVAPPQKLITGAYEWLYKLVNIGKVENPNDQPYSAVLLKWTKGYPMEDAEQVLESLHRKEGVNGLREGNNEIWAAFDEISDGFFERHILNWEAQLFAYLSYRKTHAIQAGICSSSFSNSAQSGIAATPV